MMTSRGTTSTSSKPQAWPGESYPDTPAASALYRRLVKRSVQLLGVDTAYAEKLASYVIDCQSDPAPWWGAGRWTDTQIDLAIFDAAWSEQVIADDAVRSDSTPEKVERWIALTSRLLTAWKQFRGAAYDPTARPGCLPGEDGAEYCRRMLATVRP